MAQQLSHGSDPVKHAAFLAQVVATTTGAGVASVGYGVAGAKLQHAALVYVVSKQFRPAAFRSVEQHWLQHGPRVIGYQATDTYAGRETDLHGYSSLKHALSRSQVCVCAEQEDRNAAVAISRCTKSSFAIKRRYPAAKKWAGRCRVAGIEAKVSQVGTDSKEKG